MEPKRFEVARRAQRAGGGWVLSLIGVDQETGQEVDMGGSEFPTNDFISEQEAQDDAFITGDVWMHQDVAMDERMALCTSMTWNLWCNLVAAFVTTAILCVPFIVVLLVVRGLRNGRMKVGLFF